MALLLVPALALVNPDVVVVLRGSVDWSAGVGPVAVGPVFVLILLGNAFPIPRVTLDALRHTHATLLLAAGVPLHVVSRRLGHASEAFTAQVYAHVLPQQGEQAAAAFAALVVGGR